MVYAGTVAGMTADELQAFLGAAFPDSPPPYVVEAVTEDGVRLRLPAAAVMVRPGNTVSGPTLMGLADSAAWLAVLARIGAVALAVTTSLHIDFLRRPPPADVLAEGRLLKLGRRLAVVDVGLGSPEVDGLVAKAQVTYSIPPR